MWASEETQSFPIGITNVLSEAMSIGLTDLDAIDHLLLPTDHTRQIFLISKLEPLKKSHFFFSQDIRAKSEITTTEDEGEFIFSDNFSELGKKRFSFLDRVKSLLFQCWLK